MVGEQPVLGPGESFEYTSGTPLPTPSGIMVGSYEMETKGGESFSCASPPFRSTARISRPAQLIPAHRSGAPIVHQKREVLMRALFDLPSPVSEDDPRRPADASGRPRAEAMEAVRTLIRWAGDDPTREGLLGTPGPGRARL